MTCSALISRQNDLKKMSQDVKLKWRCLECKSKQPKQDNTNTPVRSSHLPKLAGESDSDGEIAAEITNVTMRRKAEIRPSTSDYITEDKLREIWRGEMRKEMETMLENTMKKTVSSQLQSINSQCAGFQECVSYISTQYEDLRKDNADLKKLLGTYSLELKSFKDENKNLKENLTDLMTRVKTLEEENMRQQQWVRLQNIEITGIPECKEEITTDIVLRVSQYIGVNIEPTDLEFAHRVQPRRAVSAARARPIIARLRQRSVKDQIIAAARKYRNMTARDVGMGSDANKIFVNEHLTKDSKMLLSSCKQKANESERPGGDEPPNLDIAEAVSQASACVAFQFAPSDVGAGKPPPYYDKLNSWLGQVLQRETDMISIEVCETEAHGVVLRYCPLEGAAANEASAEAVAETLTAALEAQLHVLHATVAHREPFRARVAASPRLRLQHVPGWAGSAW